MNSQYYSNSLSYKAISTVLLLIMFSQDAVSQQRININNNLDNYPIMSSYEDTTDFKGDVYSVQLYESVAGKDLQKDAKSFNGKKFNLKSYAEYLPDRRKRYKEYIYDGKKRIEKYYYDDAYKNLILYQFIEDYPTSKWLIYDDKNILAEEIYYRVYGNNEFDYEGYIKYHKETSGNATIITVNEYGYDSLPDPSKIYTFTVSGLTKKRPLYQSKFETFKFINGLYKPDTTYQYVFENRNVYFKYDTKGYLLSEIWIMDSKLENKTEYTYEDDYRTVIQQDYHKRGTEKSTRRTKKYDTNNNIIFEQSIEYTGNPLSITTYEYQYDDRGNWTERKKFYQDVSNGILGKKELLEHQLREINYYRPNQQPKDLKLPAMPAEALSIPKTIPRIASEKQKVIDEFNHAVETGNFDTDIKVKTAKTIEEFTPKYWKLKGTAFGNLDDDVTDEEIAAVYETPNEGEMGFEQRLAVYKKKNGLWTLWRQSAAPVLSSAHGGMMGNPFVGIDIQRRCIVIYHFGGSRQKWSYTHRYRFQNNNWYAIGATINFGAPCDYFENLDYNMVTGDVIVSHEIEECNEENDDIKETGWKETFKHKKPLILMDDFMPGYNEMKLPGRKETIYY